MYSCNMHIAVHDTRNEGCIQHSAHVAHLDRIQSHRTDSEQPIPPVGDRNSMIMHTVDRSVQFSHGSSLHFAWVKAMHGVKRCRWYGCVPKQLNALPTEGSMYSTDRTERKRSPSRNELRWLAIFHKPIVLQSERAFMLCADKQIDETSEKDSNR